MGLLDRLGLTTNRGVPPSIATLDLRPAGQQRISRPVSYVGTGAALRQPADLGKLTGEGFSGSAVVYRCVQQIATNAAALDLCVDRMAPDGSVVPDLTHPIALLWNRYPNPSMSARTLKEVVWSQLELAGECFLYVDRGETGTGEPSALWPIYDPVEVVVDRSTAGTLQGYRVVVSGGRKVPLLPGEVLWLRYPHPSNPWGCVSPLRAAAFSVDLDTWAKQWQLGELQNGARPEGVVYLGDVDPDVHEAAVADFDSRHRGPSNASRHLFTSGPTSATYTRMGLTPAEMSYLDSRRVNAEDIALAFGVPMDLLRGGSTYENQRAAKVNLWTDTLVPKLEVVAGEVDRQLLPDLMLSARFVTDRVDALQENQDAIVKRQQQLMYVDAITVDEAREAVGLDPLPDRRGERTLTPFRQAELDLLPGALTEAEAQARAAQLVLTLGADAAPIPPQRRAAVTVTDTRRRRVQPLTQDQVQRQYDRLETAGLRTVKRLAEKQQRVVMAKAAKEGWRKRQDVETRAQVSDVFDVPYWETFTREALAPFVGAVYDQGASATAAALGLSFDQLDLIVLVAMDARLDVLAAQVTETTRSAIEQQLLLEGVAAGESVPKLADRLQSVFTHLTDSRAATIARTETVGGYNAASRIAATSSGVVGSRTWQAASDNRVRDSHADLDGYTTQGMDDAYPNGLMHPGDPHGEAKETVNCRCVEVYELADA